MDKYKKLLSELDQMEAEKLSIAVADIEEAIKNCVTKRERFGGVDYPTIARLISHYALSIADQSRLSGASKSNFNAPQWKVVAEEVNAFVESLPSKLKKCCCTSEITEAQIAQFATLAARRRGTQTQGLYLTFVLFLCQLSECKKLANEYLELILTSDEKRAPNRLITAMTAMLQLPNSDGTPATPTLGITVNFEVRQERFDALVKFVDSFAHGADRCAHMVIYRPMRSDPKRLIKSFLALSPPKRVAEDKNSFVFTHIYNPPRAGNLRIGSGKIVPLDDAVYFVGGQKPEIKGHTLGANYSPFSSMKVIAIRWIDITSQHSIMPAIAISTNYSGRLISSRVALRITPAQKAKHLDLGAVSCSDLIANLTDDIEVEKKALELVENSQDPKRALWHPENAAKFKVNHSDDDLLELAREITKLANNAPSSDSDWRVPDGFNRTSTKSRTDTLDDIELMSCIAKSLKSSSGKSFEKDGETFQLWEHIRMSPLQID